MNFEGLLLKQIKQISFEGEGATLANDLFSNTRVPTQVNTSQYESIRVCHESTRINTSLTGVNTSLKGVNTSLKGVNTSPTQVNTNQHKSKSILVELTESTQVRHESNSS